MDHSRAARNAGDSRLIEVMRSLKTALKLGRNLGASWRYEFRESWRVRPTDSTGLMVGAVGIEIESLHPKSRKRNDVAPPPLFNWSLLEPREIYRPEVGEMGGPSFMGITMKGLVFCDLLTTQSIWPG